MSINQREYRHALGRFVTDITVVTSKVEEVVHGMTCMTCNAFMSISLDKNRHAKGHGVGRGSAII